MAIRDEVLKQLLEGYKKPEDLLGPGGLLKQLTAALVGKARRHGPARLRERNGNRRGRRASLADGPRYLLPVGTTLVMPLPVTSPLDDLFHGVYD